MIDGLRNSNFYGVELKYLDSELMVIEARKTKVEMLNA